MTAEKVIVSGSNMAESNNMADSNNNLSAGEDDSDEYLTHRDVELYLKKNPEFAKKYVFNYLSSHHEFANEFFQAWYDNMIGLTLKRGGGNSSRKQQTQARNGDLDEITRSRLVDEDLHHHQDVGNEESSSAFFVGEEIVYTIPFESTASVIIKNSNNDKVIATSRRCSEPIAAAATTSLQQGGDNDISCNTNTVDVMNKRLAVRSGSEECLDTIEEDVIVPRCGRSSSMVLPQETRYRTMSVDGNNNINIPNISNKNTATAKSMMNVNCYEEALMVLSNIAPSSATGAHDANDNATANSKPHLRKAQSAPTYKKKLSNLICSSVFSGAATGPAGKSKHIKVENHTSLREFGESNYIVEIIKDISKDMSLSKVCFKIIVNLGFLLDIEKASIFIVRAAADSCSSDGKQRVLKLLLDDVSIAKGVRKESLSSSLSKQPRLVPIGSGIVGHVAETGESLLVNSIAGVSWVFIQFYLALNWVAECPEKMFPRNNAKFCLHYLLVFQVRLAVR